MLQSIQETVCVRAQLRRNRKKGQNIYELEDHQNLQLFRQLLYEGQPCQRYPIND